MLLQHKERFKLRTSDFDSNDMLKHHALFDIFQDIAGRHADILGIGYEFCKSKNLIWVLLNNKIEICKNAKLNSDVILRTWPQEKGRVDFLREYELKDIDGNIIAKATSRWVVVNANTRRIERASALSYDGEIVSDKCFESFEKIKVSIPHNKQFLGTHKVLKNDLDHNGHMNNSKYVEIIYNMYDLKQSDILTIDYLNEAMLNESIDIFSFVNNKDRYIVGYVGLKECFIAKLEEK